MAQKNKKSKKSIEDEKKYRLVKIGVVIIAIVFVIVLYRMVSIIIENNENIDMSGGSYYQYFYGILKEYSGNMEVVRTDTTTQVVLEDGETIYLDSTPIYYREDVGKVLFASKMAVVYPRSSSLFQLEEFTNIIQENGNIYAKKYNKDNKVSINNAFLYDGSDLYFFLEDTIVTIGDSEYELSTFSYAIVNYRQNVEIYDYEKDEYTILDEEIAQNYDVTATNKTGEYIINLSVDSYSTGSSDQLLIKNLDYLSELDY